MKRLMALSITALAAFSLVLSGCSSATSNSSSGSSGSSSSSYLSTISFEPSTPSYFQNSTGSSDGAYFLTITGLGNGGSTTVDVTNNGSGGNTGVTGAPTASYDGSYSLHLTSTLSSTSALNMNGDSSGTVATTATAVELKLTAAGTGSGLTGNLTGGTTITDTNSNQAINNSGTTVNYSAAFFVPTGTSIKSMGLILGDDSGNWARLPAQTLVAGSWNYITWSVLGGTYSSGTLTNASYTFAAGTPYINGGSGYTANSAGATLSGTMIATSVTNTASGSVTVPGRVAGGGGSGTLNTGTIRYAMFVPVSTTSGATSAYDWFIDDVNWH